MFQHTRLSVGVAVVAATSLGVAGLGAGAAISAPHPSHAIAATPTLKVFATKAKFSVNGPTKFAPGTVAMTLKGNGQTDVASFKPGYSYAKAVKDVEAFGASYGPTGPTKAGLRHFNRALDNSTFYGGLAVDKGSVSKGTISLDQPGTYYVFNDSGNGPSGKPVKLTVKGPKAHRAPVHTSATLKALTIERWGGDTTLPATGTIKFKNVSSGKMESPHFIELQRVKPGTTRKEVIDFLNNGHGQPSFGLPGSFGTDIVGPGQAMTVSYHQKAGTYALMCFFPDRMTGIPHALMGMVKIVTLK
jgi:hypothetical protein